MYDRTVISRRAFLQLTTLAGVTVRCASTDVITIPREGLLLHAQRQRIVDTTAPAAVQRLGLATGRDGAFYVPGSRTAKASPLIVMLHGANGAGERVISHVLDAAEALSAIVVAPDSRGPTWDLMAHRTGIDAPFIDAAIQKMLDTYLIDTSRIIVAGFSDGASYALTLGLTNPQLFSGVAAFSPGFLVLGRDVAQKARVLVTHGTRDTILPIDKCGRTVVRQLRGQHYDVDYREFDGPHALPPPDILNAGLSRLLAL